MTNMPVTPADCRDSVAQDIVFLRANMCRYHRNPDEAEHNVSLHDALNRIERALQPCAGVTEVSVEELAKKLAEHLYARYTFNDWRRESINTTNTRVLLALQKMYPQGLKIKGEK